MKGKEEDGVTYRLVVPSAFLPVLRAEQTTTTLFLDKLALHRHGQSMQYVLTGGLGKGRESGETYLTISRAI